MLVIRGCMCLLSLTATCQVWTVALKAGHSTYNWAAADAQRPGRVRRIGVLQTGSPLPEVEHQGSFLQQFLRGLHELGWVEGHTLAIEYRWAHGQYERLPDLAAELVQLQSR